MADRTFTTSYDADGQPVAQTQPGGVSLTAGYDLNGDLTSQTGTGADAATASRTFGYDADGRMTSAATSAAGTQTATSEAFTFNDRGDLLTTSGSGGSSSFAYNPDNLLTSRTDAAGTTTYGYDSADRLSTLNDAATGAQSTYSYNSMEQVSAIHYGTGDTRSCGYNSLHERTSDTLKTSAGATVASIGYGYDLDGNLTSKNTTGFAGASSNTYTYDEANRLTSWNNGTSTVNYGYDASGNRTQVGSNVYTYDARDQLTSDGVNSYSYTARGTMSSQMNTSGSLSYSSDAFGQMIGVSLQNYTYDAFGRTINDTTTGGSATAGFSYSGVSNTIASDSTSTYTYDPGDGLVGIGTAAAGGGTVAGSGVLAYVDQHMDVVGDFGPSSATLTGSTTYDPLGNVTSTSNQAGSLGYQSGWTDNATGKVNMASRWYNPATGQFMNRDSASNNPVPNSAEANPFAYVDDNPLTGTDPSGHGWFSSAFHWVAKHVVKPVAHFVNKRIIKPVVRVVKKVVKPIVHAVKTVVHKVKDVYHAAVRVVKRVVHRVVHAVRTVARAAVHVVSTAYHAVKKAATKAVHAVAKVVKKTVKAVAHTVKKAAVATAQFVQHHATAIVSFAAGAATFVGCEALTAGIGTIGCAALAGAVGNAVSYGVSCGGSADGCSVGGALEAVGLGAAEGVAGGSLGELVGPLAGRLVTEALDGALPEVAVAGLSGAAGGAAAGSATSAAMYGLTCGTTKSGCSAGGLASAAGGGAAFGAIAGAGGGAKGAMADSGEGAPAQPKAGEDDATGCAAAHSFIGSTKVLLADGSSKPISQVKVGDRVADSVPGSTVMETHPVARVIVTKTDHDFVRVTVKRLGKIAAVAATAVTAATLLVGPAQAATVTTTYHHPFYDVTQSAFVDADHLAAGDVLQSVGGVRAEITAVHQYHATTTTYDLTINGLHTYYVEAGATPLLVHNCGEDLSGHATVYLDKGNAHASIAVTRGNVTIHSEQVGTTGTDAVGAQGSDKIITSSR
ncbi:MAG TPA: RHS repeat-associated core domain-containing protein [Pseudonocardiaceae bacterium]|nr:RHS repeat-associated core domain-containing protein [Pseudonocardiaceae bacterium]